MADPGQGGLRFCVLGSSSKGNCTLVSTERTTVLIDSGLPAGYIKENVDSLTGHGKVHGIFVSHEHGDHISSLGAVSRMYGCPVYLSKALAFMLKGDGIEDIRVMSSGNKVRVGDICVTPVRVQHDAIEPMGFLVEASGARLGIATDLGMVGPSLLDIFRGVDGLVIESNYDRDMLARGPYPYPLKNRIINSQGHLSNTQCGDFIKLVTGPETREIVLAHLSEENNDPLIAARECTTALRTVSKNCRLHISYPRYPTPMLNLGRRVE